MTTLDILCYSALGARVLLGLGQALTSLPSHFPALADTARLRMPMIYLGNGAVFLGLWWHQGGRPALARSRRGRGPADESRNTSG